MGQDVTHQAQGKLETFWRLGYPKRPPFSYWAYWKGRSTWTSLVSLTTAQEIFTRRLQPFQRTCYMCMDTGDNHFQPIMWLDEVSQGLRYAPTISDHHQCMKSVLLLKVWASSKRIILYIFYLWTVCVTNCSWECNKLLVYYLQ
jgi:hypothetical protein